MKCHPPTKLTIAVRKQLKSTRFLTVGNPDRKQRQIIKLWFDAARWCYNKTIETLRQPDTTANWKKIKTSIINATPPHPSNPPPAKSKASQSGTPANP